MARGGHKAALVLAMEEERMNHTLFWPAAAALAWGLGCYAVFYGAAVLIERRHNRQRSAHLRNRLRLRA